MKAMTRNITKVSRLIYFVEVGKEFQRKMLAGNTADKKP